MKHRWTVNSTFFLYKSDEKEIYYIRRNGIVDVLAYYPKEEKEELWLQEGYTDCKILFQNDRPFPFGNSKKQTIDFCYVLLKDITDYGQIVEIVSKYVVIQKLEYNNKCIALAHYTNKEQEIYCYILFEDTKGNGVVMEIFTKEVLLCDFKYSDKRSIKRISPEKGSPQVRNDAIIGFLNRENKTFSLFSVLKGYLYEPYNYSVIEEHSKGVILDNKTIVTNDGIIKDIKGYLRKDKVIYNIEKGDFILLIDDKEEENMFVYMDYGYDEEGKLKDKVSGIAGEYNYTFDIYRGKLDYESRYQDAPYHWSQSDAWDAMTDGQYGDYSGDDIDYDKLGF